MNNKKCFHQSKQKKIFIRSVFIKHDLVILSFCSRTPGEPGNEVVQNPSIIISNSWMRLSRISRILKIKEGVIRRGRRPRWITLSEICRILHMLREPNSITALLFTQNIFPFLKECRHFTLSFCATQNNAIWSPDFLCQRFNNLQQAILSTSLAQYDEDSFQIWSTTAVYGELCVWEARWPHG